MTVVSVCLVSAQGDLVIKCVCVLQKENSICSGKRAIHVLGFGRQQDGDRSFLTCGGEAAERLAGLLQYWRAGSPNVFSSEKRREEKHKITKPQMTG